MTKKEIAKAKSILDKKVEVYFDYANRDDYPDKPCVRRAVAMAQNTVFDIAEILHNLGVISWEECCEYWSKVGLVDDVNETCPYKECGANVDGFCKYTQGESE